jgi:aldose 1-epimerase
MTTAAARTPVARDRLEGFGAVTLRAGELEATFVPELGMVGASLRHAGEELLDRRDGLRAYRDTGAVMGLPLLHPWANRLAGDRYELHGRAVDLRASARVRRDERGLPIHGLLAAHPGWVASRVAALPGRARLRARLDFGAFPDLLAAFPFRHELQLDVTLAPDRLRVSTTVRATGGVPVPVAFGHHPYLQLPGVGRRAWRIALPARREVALDARGIPAAPGERRPVRHFMLADGTFDDAFDRVADGARFVMAGGGRAITVRHDHGYPIAQVYAPAGSPFLCFEPMTAPVDALRTGAGLRRVAPGGRFTASFTILVGES